MPPAISAGEALSVTAADGEIVHFFYYPPRNARFTGPPRERPPLIVMSHGGPTSMHTNALSLGVQWFTSRGFAVAHVNYRGSSGFGRAYRDRLAGEWGVLDVADCISVARHLAATDRCDPARIAIRGGSASGLTALLAVATSDVFRAAASLLRRDGTRIARGRHAQVRSALHRRPRRSAAGNARTLSRTLARQPRRDHQRAGDPVSEAWTTTSSRPIRPRRCATRCSRAACRSNTRHSPAKVMDSAKPRRSARVLERELAFYRDVFGLTSSS